jgi:hypothetical protein
MTGTLPQHTLHVPFDQKRRLGSATLTVTIQVLFVGFVLASLLVLLGLSALTGLLATLLILALLTVLSGLSTVLALVDLTALLTLADLLVSLLTFLVHIFCHK